MNVNVIRHWGDQYAVVVNGAVVWSSGHATIEAARASAEALILDKGWDTVPAVSLSRCLYDADCAPTRIAAFEESAAAWAKRAKKLGCGDVHFAKEAVRVVEETEWRGDVPWPRKVTRQRAYVVMVTPQLAGWMLHGVIDHRLQTEAGGAAIVRGVPGATLHAYRQAKPICQHCNTTRPRAETVVVAKDGKTMQIGKSCVQDYLGANPAGVFAALLFIDEIARAGDEDSEWGGAGGRPLWDVEHVLYLTAACVRRFGYVSRNVAEETGNEPTRITVINAAVGKGKEHDKLLVELELPAHRDEDRAQANATLDYIAALDPRSDFEHNLKAVLSAGMCTGKNIGYACAAVPAYLRHVERLVAAKKAKDTAKPSQHVGVVGKRITFAGTVTVARKYDGTYGTTMLLKIVQPDGAVLSSFASGASVMDLKPGMEISGKATVKEHGEFAGVPETKVSRIALD